MTASTGRLDRLKLGAGAVTLAGVAALGFGMAGTGHAAGEPIDGFFDIPGIADGKPGDFRKWLRIEGHYWTSEDVSTFGGGRNRLRRNSMWFGGPGAPKKGAGKLMIAVDKRNPALKKMMAACEKQAAIPEMIFAESSELVRGLAEAGEIPGDVPKFYEYRLKGVTIGCPVLAEAPDQGLVLSFKEIEWVNYRDIGDGIALTVEPAVLTPIKTSGATKTFIVSWFGVAHDVAEDQCPKMNVKPSEDDYYRLVPREEADKERAELVAKKTAVSYENGQMGRRGPGRLNVTMLPGLVPDPGHHSPQTSIARGINLDRDDGTGKPPANVCRHKNYVGDDGYQGIDNQLYTVEGCMQGYQGHNGFLMQYRNEQMRNGGISILFQISGIDDPQNDDSITVTLLYSKDPMAKNAAGSQILHDYTYRVSQEPGHAYYTRRLNGRIVGGVIETYLVDKYNMHQGLGPEVRLRNAGMRLKIMPDGSLKGVLGGYEDWRKVMALNANSNSEQLYGFQAPGLYAALKRAADGLKDPETGQCYGISVAYDIEASPAFIPPSQLNKLVAQTAAPAKGAR